MKEKWKKWIDAFEKVHIDPDVKVICPECDMGQLILKKEPAPEYKKIDWYLICDNCGKWNVSTASLSE